MYNWLCLVDGQCGNGCVWWMVSVELAVLGRWSVWNWLCLVSGRCGTGCVWWMVSVELAAFDGCSMWNCLRLKFPVLGIVTWLLGLCANHCTTDYRR